MKIEEKKLDAAFEALEIANNYRNRLALGLSVLKMVQEGTSALVPGCITEEVTKDQLKEVYVATSVEFAELMQELNWKSWKPTFVEDKELVAKEFADILAFLGLFMVYLDKLGVNTDELAEAYVQKTKLNVDRFIGNVAGYRHAG